MTSNKCRMPTIQGVTSLGFTTSTPYTTTPTRNITSVGNQSQFLTPTTVQPAAPRKTSTPNYLPSLPRQKLQSVRRSLTFHGRQSYLLDLCSDSDMESDYISDLTSCINDSDIWNSCSRLHELTDIKLEQRFGGQDSSIFTEVQGCSSISDTAIQQLHNVQQCPDTSVTEMKQCFSVNDQNVPVHIIINNIPQLSNHYACDKNQERVQTLISDYFPVKKHSRPTLHHVLPTAPNSGPVILQQKAVSNDAYFIQNTERKFRPILPKSSIPVTQVKAVPPRNTLNVEHYSYTAEQWTQLEVVFLENPFCPVGTKQVLGGRLGLAPDSVLAWLRNARSRMRLQLTKETKAVVPVGRYHVAVALRGVKALP